MGPEEGKDHCRGSHRGLPVKGSAFKGARGEGKPRERARDMTYISLHLNQLWVQLRALDFQWRLKGWSKWWYKRISRTKNTMVGGQRQAAGLIARGLIGIFFSVPLFKAQFKGLRHSDEH